MADFDKQRLRDDPGYRQKVLDNMARKAKNRWFYAKLRTAFFVLLAAALFALGLFVGGRLTARQSDWVTLILICLFIIPMMGWMLITVRNHRKKFGEQIME